MTDHTHDWQDVTTMADTARVYACACGAIKREPRRGCGCHS